MNLPSFLWLWRAAAWAMGLTLLAYGVQLFTGLLFRSLQGPERSPEQTASLVAQLRTAHWWSGWVLVTAVLFLLAIGIVGTLGHFGSLGHSTHLWAGGTVVLLVLGSAASSLQINKQSWARPLHLSVNFVLLLALAWVSWSGWEVVQKYLPKE